ncbi:MAG: response regulator [Candidatus Brocadiia bacterium]
MADEAPRILVVDDDPDFLETARGVLEGAGYRVDCAASPQEAWASIGEHPPALIILDLMLRAADTGFSLARKLRADRRYADVPLVLITAASGRLREPTSRELLEHLAAQRTDAFLEKPLVPEELVETVRELLARRPAGP